MSEIPIPGQMVMVFAEECDRGKLREENQDTVWHARIALGELLIVADGIGGYLGGATASQMAVNGFHKYLANLAQDYPPDRAIREASAFTNANILAEAHSLNSDFRRMGSTVVLALLQQDTSGTRVWIGHIGDSRAYLVRDGQLSRLTNDHSAVQALLNRNLITPLEALHHPDGSVLTRSLGHKPEVEIDINMFPLVDGDSLILCSDGLWGYVPEKNIQMVAANPELTLEIAARTLLNLALAAGGPDNIGIEIVRLSSPPIAVAQAVKEPHRHGLMEILALCLLAIAGLGTLAYFVTQHHWLHTLQHLR